MTKIMETAYPSKLSALFYSNLQRIAIFMRSVSISATDGVGLRLKDRISSE